jgi:hypothetical protein
MNDAEVKIKSAVAIYRGLPAPERAQRLDALEYAMRHDPLPERQRMARTLYPLLENAEREIRAQEREMCERIRAEVLRSIPQPALQSGYDHNPQRSEEMRRAVRSAVILALLIGGGVAAFHAVVSSGLIPYLIGGALIVFCLSAMHGGGSENSDCSQTPEPTRQTGQSQTIIFNVSQNGNITFEQKE